MPAQSQAKSIPRRIAPKEASVRPTTNNQRIVSAAPTISAQPSTAAHSAPSSPQRITLPPARSPQPQPAMEQAQITQQRLIRHRVSAFQLLLVLFGRLCAEDYPQSRDMPEDFVLPKEWERGLPQPAVSAATHFLRSLPHVHDPRSIPAGEQHGCMICSLPFLPLATPIPGQDHYQNVACALPCGHYFCCGCLEHYIKPHLDTPRDTCPFCRSILFVNWLHFGYFTTLPGQINIVGWADKDHDTKILIFQNWVAPVEKEYNVAFQRWQANSLTVSAANGYGATYTPDFLMSTQITSPAQITPRLVLHHRARLELHLRKNMIHFLRLWIQWMEDPTELQPLLEPEIVTGLFKLRREQEWDPTGLHEANARRRAIHEFYRPFQ